MADKVTIDFTNVKEGGNFTKKRLPAGDYKARVTKWEKAKPKDKDDKSKMWLFTIAIEGRHGATYPFYCKLVENQLWKVRNLLVAAGVNVPKKKVAVDPEKVVGKMIGVTLDDTEYEGRDQSEVSAVFPASEVEGATVDDDDDDDDDDDEDEDEDEDEAPKKSKSKKAKKKAKDEDEDDEDDEDDSDSEDDDEDDEDEEEEKPSKKKGKKSKKSSKKKDDDDDDDEDDDELDIEDL